MPINTIFMFKLRSLDDLPVSERWYVRYHAVETLARSGPWIPRYVSYRALPMMKETVDYGYYDYRVTELWWYSENDVPQFFGKSLAITGPGPRPPTTRKEEVKPYYSTEWTGKPGGPYPVVQVFIPGQPTEDFKGNDVTPDEKTIFRWFTVFKYPDGVSVKDGEDWFLNVHSKEVLKQPGLTRYFSYRAIDIPTLPSQHPWHRVTELWYENYDAWLKSVIESPPEYTVPPWATYRKYPFLAPYVDFVSTFILERPTDDFKRDWRGYV